MIGVAKDAQVAHLGKLDTSYLYFPAGPEADSQSYMLVRYATSFKDVSNGIRHAVKSLTPMSLSM